MKRIIVSVISAVMLIMISAPGFVTAQMAVVPLTTGQSNLNVATAQDTRLLRKSLNILRPKQFKGVIRMVDTTKNVIFFKSPGKKERVMVTPRTVLLTFTKDDVQQTALSELTSGDRVFGFVRRIPKFTSQDGTEVFYAGLVLIRFNVEEGESMEDDDLLEAVLALPMQDTTVQQPGAGTVGPNPPVTGSGTGQ